MCLIITNESYFNIESYVLEGELNLVLQGSFTSYDNNNKQGKTLTNVGEADSPLQSCINISVEPYSSILCYGGPFNLSN